MATNFQGVGVALVTPFTQTKAIDTISLGKLIDFVIDNGVDYIVSLGTTGETATLSKEEQQEVLDFTIKQVNKRVPIVAGFGGNDTTALIKRIKEANLEGITAILSASPYYNKPSQEGIYQHYKALAENSPLPIILYNVPGRTSKNINAATTIRLAQDFKNIIGIKEASGNLLQCMEIVNKKNREDFFVVSGDDALTVPMIAIGMTGVISVVANAFPKTFTQAVHTALQGNFTESQKYHYQLLDIINLLFEDGNPGGVKAALQHLGICTETMRLPLVPINKTVRSQLIQAIEKIG